MIRRRLGGRMCKLVVVTFIAAVATIFWHFSRVDVHAPQIEDWWPWQPPPPANSAPSPTKMARPLHTASLKLNPWNASSVLAGNVISDDEISFKSRLRNDTYYITSWTDGGFTNAMMTYVNVIYLGMISNRVPIIPPFVAWHHIDASAGTLAFSEIFDLHTLKNTLRMIIVEWSDIRSLPANQDKLQPVGCWSAWATGNLDEHSPRGTTNRIASHVGLDVSYTAVPYHTRRKENRADWGLLFSRLAALIYPPSEGDSLSDDLQTPFPSPNGISLAPDTQLACFDLLYFVTTDIDDSFEWSERWNIMWRTIGQHMKFRKRLILLAQAYLRSAFELSSTSAVPPFIAVHVRHGDFGGACGGDVRPEYCFAPLSAYAARVKEVQEELRRKKGITIADEHVLLTSDEADPKFWEQVVELGWTYFDHKAMATQQNLGEWYITLIDVVAASLSVGFVGTERSTVTIINTKRVEYWNDGVTRIVRWGQNAH